MLRQAATTILRKFGLRRDFQERAFTSPRRWSNRELRRVAPLLSGSIINVSAWKDLDKEGNTYESYFTNRTSYHITNFGSQQGNMQGTDNEYYLDLEKPLQESLNGKFDVVFNHTTLEHVWDLDRAFSNLCDLSSDIVILVVPWIQPLHTDYGDYWRISPQAVAKMFHERHFGVVDLTWSTEPGAAVYVFAVASRNPTHWAEKLGTTIIDPTNSHFLRLPPRSAGSRLFG